LKPFYAVGALAFWAFASINQAKADEASGPSVSSCSVGEPSEEPALTPELLAINRAIFMKLCGQVNGALVYAHDSRLLHNLTQPAVPIGPGLHNFYPPEAIRHGQTGKPMVSYVVEADGRISWAVVSSSSGIPALDVAALQFIYNIKFKTPAYFNGTAVRVFSSMFVEFALH
jgi:TonB family protein